MKKLFAMIAAALIVGAAPTANAQSAASARSDGMLFAQNQGAPGEATKKKAAKAKGKATQTKKSETVKKGAPKKKGSGKKKATPKT